MKKLFFAAICALVGVAVHADAMYWQLNDTKIKGLTDSDWTMARIEVYTGDPAAALDPAVYLDVYDGENWNSGVKYVANGEEGAWFNLGSYNSAAYSFVLELVNDSFQVQAASAPISYSSLGGKVVATEDYGTVFDTITPVSYSTYNVAAGQVVDLPEPTSGLLMLLGASLLALRRRQA